jgi:hypothetical protein
VDREEHDHAPVGIRLRCEVCGEESLLAIPVARARYGLVDCPGCRTGYLMLLEQDVATAGRPVVGG